MYPVFGSLKTNLAVRQKNFKSSHTKIRSSSVVAWLIFAYISVISPCFTEPFAAVQLHSHADVHGVICDGHEADEASDDGWLQVLQHNVVGVPVPFDHLQVRETELKERPFLCHTGVDQDGL